MKNLYKLLIGVLALSTVTSCDDYLEVDHYDILPADFMFKTEENVLSGLNGLYDTFYTDQHGSGDDETWGFKPQVFAANHSTMDCQASGWDAEWQRHAWKPDKFPGDCMADELSCSGPCKPFPSWPGDGGCLYICGQQFQDRL